MSGDPGRVLVIGVGNAARGDDAAGLLVARVVEGRAAAPGAPPAAARVAVACVEGEMLSLLDRWRDAEAVIVVDAVRSGAAAGTVRRFDARGGPLPAALRFTSTHAFSVAGAVELARALGRLPPRVVVYAVEGREFGDGAPLSPAVEAGVVRAAEAVFDEAVRAAAPSQVA